MADKLTVCVCGGGNGAHAMAGLAAAHPSTESRVLTLFQDEAARWTKLLQEGDFTIKLNKPDKSVVEIKAKPALVTKDPSQAIPGANIVIFCVPAFAHEQYFKAIAPHVEPNTAVIGLPGQPGFEFQCFALLKNARQCAVLSYESLPWACRILEFGRLVEILGAKDSLMGSIIKGKSQLRLDAIKTLQAMLGDHPVLKLAKNYLEPYLMTKSIVHPPIMYARWKDWDGQPLAEKPLFYQGLDEFGAARLSGVSDEVVATAKVISKKKAGQLDQPHVQHLLDWYRQDYRETVQDPTSLHSAMKTNSAYNGLVHPMKDAGSGKWVPDFGYRYLAEDVPFGLVVTKGLAQLAGVPTPETDRVLAWCQDKLGKEYLVGSELKGKDVASTRAPQAYGFQSLDDLVSLL